MSIYYSILKTCATLAMYFLCNSMACAGDTSSIAQGEYLVGLLGCEGCHTDGYLRESAPLGKPLSGSEVGLAFRLSSNQLPAIVFPPNLTPDKETGLGEWSREDIAIAITSGVDRHDKIIWPVMPWPSLSKLKQTDAYAIADFLKSLSPVRHEVPDNVPAGEPSDEDYVLFMMEADKSHD